MKTMFIHNWRLPGRPFKFLHQKNSARINCEVYKMCNTLMRTYPHHSDFYFFDFE